MPKEEITSVIAEIVERVSGVPAAQATPESVFTDIGIDSLTKLEIIVATEDQFGVRIDDDDGERLLTVSDVADYITRSRVTS